MRICIPNDGESLIDLARKYGAELKELIALNPHIPDANLNIAGKPIKLPASAAPAMQSFPVPICPEPPLPKYLDTWIPLTSLEEMEQIDYDILIVGTGAGGGAVLWRLCEQLRENGKRIGIIDAGNLFLPTHALNLPTMNFERYTQFFLNPKFWSRVGELSADSAFNGLPPEIPLDFEQFLALGGRTLLWYGCSPRMHACDMVDWPVSCSDMDKYYNIAEEIIKVTQTYSQQSQMTRKVLELLRNDGFPETVEMPQAIDRNASGNGQIFSNAFFSSIIFLAMAMNRRNIDLAVNARAVQVFTENRKISGIKVMSPDMKAYYLKAKKVVLSASTFETPRLLLNSGIYGPAIGHYLANHSRIISTGIVNRCDFPEDLGSLTVLVPRTDTRLYQVQLYGPGTYFWNRYREIPLRSQWSVDYIGSGVVESRFDNYMELDPYKRDEYGVPEVNIHFEYSEPDKEIIRQMRDGMRRISQIIKSPFIPINGNADMCLRFPGKEFHELGTCRIGHDPSTSAADPFGQIHGISGLYVADNSVIPTSGAANPTLTTIALAIRTADYIVGQLK